MNVEIGAEAELFPEKEYINEIFFAVHGVFERRSIYTFELNFFFMYVKR